MRFAIEEGQEVLLALQRSEEVNNLKDLCVTAGRASILQSVTLASGFIQASLQRSSASGPKLPRAK